MGNNNEILELKLEQKWEQATLSNNFIFYKGQTNLNN